MRRWPECLFFTCAIGLPDLLENFRRDATFLGHERVILPEVKCLPEVISATISQFQNFQHAGIVRSRSYHVSFSLI